MATALAGVAVAAPAAASPDLGVMIDAGFPDGAAASITWNPARFARLHAGVAHNAIRPGVRAGATYLPLRWRMAPVFALEAGWFSEGDAGPAARLASGDPRLYHPSLERVGYEFAAARAGFEVRAGATRLFLHAGASFVRGDVRGVQDALTGSGDGGDGARLEIRDDPEIRALVPSARAGFLIHF